MTEPKTPEERNLSPVLWLGVGGVVAALLIYGFLSPGDVRPSVGDVAPPFTLALFDGSRLSLSELRGQVVVVNFWASWCAPCRREAPALQQVWDDYQARGVAFVGVTYMDAPEASQAFVDEFGLVYPNGVDERRQISRAYGVSAVPETFVIDRAGRIAAVHVGEIGVEDLVQDLEPLVGP
jgi:peroxiredoxin